MWAKTSFFLASFCLLYGLVVFGPVSPGLWLVLTTELLGACNAGIGFNICHDALHGAFSANKRVNQVFSLLFNLVGANSYVWNLTHNVVHHTYTNIPGHDEDIEVAPGLIRLSPEELWRPWQRYQHLYALPLYGLASLSWLFRKDYVKFCQAQIGAHVSHHLRREYVNLFGYKALYYLLFIALPLAVVPLPWGQVLLGFLVLHLVEGVVMGLVFQLAHVVEGTTFSTPRRQRHDAGRLGRAPAADHGQLRAPQRAGQLLLWGAEPPD
ncbi:fatty acid desaturase family protein [Hymenobacter siberiensis]|uniref:fatty acid desaturase family protein n=1 Tax=Hymenobacter siberiensis TaxID=2848396 RepID=UPI00293D6B36|nr:fatty acid desaturase [Hymenobacter siberiensis]